MGRRGLAGSALAAALVLAAAPAAGAHPTPVSNALRAGESTTITVFLYPDEGAITGFDVTLPTSFRLVSVEGGVKLPVVMTSGTVVRFRRPVGAAPMDQPDIATVSIVGTPASTPVYLGIVAQRATLAPYDYGQVLVGGPVSSADPSSTGSRIALTAGVLAAGGIAVVFAERTRRRRRRRGTLIG